MLGHPKPKAKIIVRVMLKAKELVQRSQIPIERHPIIQKCLREKLKRFKL
jgi:hypothetical protein